MKIDGGIIMHRFLMAFLSMFIMLQISFPVLADPIDGKMPLLCATIKLLECQPDKGCFKVSIESAGLPRFAKIDFAGKRILPIRAADTKQSSPIDQIKEIDGKLILQGAEDGIKGIRDGVGWSMAITQDTGDLVLTASGDKLAFVLFGACTNIKE